MATETAPQIVLLTVQVTGHDEPMRAPNTAYSFFTISGMVVGVTRFNTLGSVTNNTRLFRLITFLSFYTFG